MNLVDLLATHKSLLNLAIELSKAKVNNPTTGIFVANLGLSGITVSRSLRTDNHVIEDKFYFPYEWLYDKLGEINES